MSTVQMEGNITFKKELSKEDAKLLADIFTQTDHSVGIRFFDAFTSLGSELVSCQRGAISGEFDVEDLADKLRDGFADQLLEPVMDKDLIEDCKLCVATNEPEDWSYTFVYNKAGKYFFGHSEEDYDFTHESEIIMAGLPELIRELSLRGWIAVDTNKITQV